MITRYKLLAWLSGLPLTLLGLVTFLAGVLPVVTGYVSATSGLALGYSLLLINLVFAILVREKIKNNPFLLLFHMALLLMLLAVGVSRLTYFKGWVEISLDMPITEPTGVISKGPWHPNAFKKTRVALLDFEANYGSDGRYQSIRSLLQVGNSQQPTLIADSQTADILGYQFTQSSNIGFALSFVWMATDGTLVQGVSHFPSQTAYPETQGIDLQLPGVEKSIWIGLDIVSKRQDFFTPEFHVPEDYSYTVMSTSGPQMVTPNSAVSLPEGQLMLNGLVPWIGYDLYYDPSIYFLLFTSLIGVCALAIFLWQRQVKTSWILENDDE